MATQHNSLQDPVPLPARAQIEGLLEDILRSAPFRTSRQCQDLFRYIVEHSLAASDGSLRERIIGIEVFGRAPDYDTAEDPVVRLRAADVRKRLAQYYQAHTEPIQWKVEIPTGSYKAHFYPSDKPSSEIAVPLTIPSRAEPALSPGPQPLVSRTHAEKRTRFWALVLLAGAIAAALLVGLFVTRTASPAATAFDGFWQPTLEARRPVLVCTGSNPVYLLSQQALDKYKSAHSHGQDATPNLQTAVPIEELRNFTIGDFYPVKDTYLTIGDASATAQVASLLTFRHHAYDLRFGSDLSFGDLRQGSAILIGAFNNSWTLNMTNNLRFVFDSGNTSAMHVQDRSDQSRSWWPKITDGKVTEDYAIVSRILDSKTGAVLVTIAGLNHTGTRAAGDFVTDPQQIGEFVKNAPKDWNRKNLQIVLHTNVVNDIPSLPTVVASYYW